MKNRIKMTIGSVLLISLLCIHPAEASETTADPGSVPSESEISETTAAPGSIPSESEVSETAAVPGSIPSESEASETAAAPGSVPSEPETAATEASIDISSLPEIADGTYYLEDCDEGDLHYYELTRSDAPIGGPLLLLLHGSTSNKGNMYAFAKSFADEGYVVVVPDLAGHGECITDTPLNVYDMITQSAQKIISILQSYADVEYVDAENFCIAGNSLGGVTALYYAAYCEPKPQCVISFYGTPVWSSIADYSSRSVRQNGQSVPLQSEEEKGKLRDLLLQNSPDQNMEELLSIPILLVNGTKDDIMPVSAIREFKKKAAEYSNQLETVIIKDHVHGLQWTGQEEKDMSKAKKFLKKYLPVPKEE